MQKVILDKTLEELDGQDWGEPTFPSSLVMNCHRLRRVPLGEFTVEDLRLMIGQQISLEYLVPLALEQLAANPFAEGNYYPGDLLMNVAKVPQAFWDEHPQLQAQWQPIAPYVAAVERYLKDDSADFPML